MRQEYYSIKISSVYNFSFYQDINKQTGKSNIISRKICVHIRYPEMTNTTENNYADKIKTLQYVIDICCGTFDRNDPWKVLTTFSSLIYLPSALVVLSHVGCLLITG